MKDYNYIKVASHKNGSCVFRKLQGSMVVLIPYNNNLKGYKNFTVFFRILSVFIKCGQSFWVTKIKIRNSDIQITFGVTAQHFHNKEKLHKQTTLSRCFCRIIYSIMY